MNILKKKARKIVKNLIESGRFEKIKVNSGKCRYNFRCHLNAVHDALNEDQDTIAMVWMIDDGWPVIHFINIGFSDSFIGGGFTDNTIGRWCETVDYYLIKVILKDDFFNVDNIFDDYRDEVNTWLPIWLRYFVSKETF